MYIPDLDFIMAPPRVDVQIALEPAHNAFNSLIILNKAHKLSGLETWVNQAALTPAQQHRNRLVLEGLFYALPINHRWPDFPACIDYLVGQSGADLVRQLLNTYLHLAQPGSSQSQLAFLPSHTELLADRALFLEFLQARFHAAVDLDLETEAHALLNTPSRLQALMVDHLREMWQNILAPEWERTHPLLAATVNAFQQLDLSRLSTVEAAERIVGRPLDTGWETNCLKEASQIFFVPSIHIGPYLGKIFGNLAGRTTLWFFFPVRQPEGVLPTNEIGLTAEVSRADLLIRLNALGDDTRLRILALLTQHQELCSQDILTELNLSQSAVSRHLKQLSASGFLLERAQAAAKCYRLNLQRIEDTLKALEQFLLN